MHGIWANNLNVQCRILQIEFCYGYVYFFFMYNKERIDKYINLCKTNICNEYELKKYAVQNQQIVVNAKFFLFSITVMFFNLIFIVLNKLTIVYVLLILEVI